jgi:hypothetical protein
MDEGLLEQHRAPWTPAQDAALLAGVVAFWREAPSRIFQIPWASIAAALPGRSECGCEQRARALRCGRQAAPAGEEGAPAGGSAGAAWTAHEDATLQAALSLRRCPMEVSVDWHCVQDGALALAGRTPSSLYQRWQRLKRSPAAQAAAAQFKAEAAVAQRRGGSSAAASAPPLAPARGPFHMLHGLRSAGAIDEQTLRVCWRAAAEATAR